MSGPWERYAKPAEPVADGPWTRYAEQPSTLTSAAAGVGKGFGQIALNAQRYAGKALDAVGADAAGQWLVQDAESGLANIEQELAPYREAHPIAAGGGELVGQVAGTWPVGGALAKVAGRALPASSPAAQKLVQSISSGGMRLGAPAATTVGGRVADTAIRAAGGAITGGAAAGLVDPEQAKTGAIVGGAFPLSTQAMGAAGRVARRAITGGGASDEVVALAQRAKQLGIDVPADRLVDSKPLNAAAASLNYVPMSGRAATEARMQSQMNRALSRTFGQDSENVTMALRKARTLLGGEFDRVLHGTGVRVDDALLDDLVRVAERAKQELSPADAKIITNQIDVLLGKAEGGIVNGQAAYNIKRTLDRIGTRRSNEAHYALDMKGALMDALNRSLGPDDAAKFATTRQQYGSMLALEKLAKNGVDGDVSIARLANMKNIRNPELQELADIAAQFLKGREGQHGAAQRVALGTLTAAAGATGMAPPVAIGAGMALGRGTNAALNSGTLRDLVLYGSAPGIERSVSALLPLTSKTLPVLSAR